MDETIRLQVYQAIAAKKEHYENFTLVTDELMDSVLNVVVERDGKFFDNDGKPIKSLPGYAAQRAEWRLIDAERAKKRPREAYRGAQYAIAADSVNHATFARGTQPSTSGASGSDVGSRSSTESILRAVIKGLEKGECHEELGVLLRQAQRIGSVLRMVLLERKSYELVHKKLGISKGTVSADVVLGKRYLRTVVLKLERKR